MKKASTLLIALVLIAIFTACRPSAPEISVNTELFFPIGQPLRYFKENLDWENAEQDPEPNYGSPVDRYTLDGVRYHFNNAVGYAAPTDDTPCTQIFVNYTELFPGIKDGELTDKLLRSFFGEHSDISANRRQYSSGYTHIYFSINENGNYEDLVELSINWGFRFNLSSFMTARENPEIEISVNTEFLSLLGKPLSYFKENIDLENAEHEDIPSDGPPEFSKYTLDGITYCFSNSNHINSGVVTDETPCLIIYADYTDVLLNIKEGALTGEIVHELFGEGKWVMDFTYEHHFCDYLLYFVIDNHGNYENPVILGIDRERRSG